MMDSPTSWEFYKEVETRILWVNICAEDLEGVNVDAYFRFVDYCQSQGIDIPIVPGVMPITNFANLKRFSSKCGAEIPLWLGNRLDDFGSDTDGMRQFGIDVVTELCFDLLEGGAPGIHFYSMNLAKSVSQIWNNLSLQLQQRDA